MSMLPGSSLAEISHRIQTVLSSRKLSMAEISRQSRVRFKGHSLFWIPAHFYQAMHHVSFSPSLHQLFAFSVLTNYRLTDWVRLFGFSFDEGIRFQAAWPRRRTTELDARIYHPEVEVPWFDEAPRIDLGNEIAPLNCWLSGKRNLPLARLARTESGFRYFQIGSDDAYAYPDLLPESIVRVNPRINADISLRDAGSTQILAIEHSLGVTCSHTRPSGIGKIMLCSKQLPYAPVEMSLGTEARILGAVDLEIRRLALPTAPTVSTQTVEHWPLKYLNQSDSRERLGEYLQRARVRLNLSLRAASDLSKEIALVLKNRNYFCSASALSDLEGSDRLPRHIHKLISLSAVYCVPIADLTARAGLSFQAAGKEAMPAQLDGIAGDRARTDGGALSRFLRTVEERFGEVPLFLHNALSPLTGLSRLSVRDTFWAGATTGLAHPYLRNAAFLVVNRRSKQPAPLLSSPLWAQPLYLIELRSGRRLCAACTLHRETLLIRPCTVTGGSLMRLRNRIEAEVLGKVVALARNVGDTKSP
jgi:transcriptional regulator with XRE-family HTH domain